MTPELARSELAHGWKFSIGTRLLPLDKRIFAALFLPDRKSLQNFEHRFWKLLARATKWHKKKWNPNRGRQNQEQNGGTAKMLVFSFSFTPSPFTPKN